MNTMEFKSSDVVYSKVNTLLHSYGEAGLLDEGQYYDWTKNILLRLNIPSFNEKETILEVKNSKAYLPDDFYMLWAVWNTTPQTQKTGEAKKEWQSSYTFYHQDLGYNKEKVDCKIVITPTEQNIIRRNVYFQDNTTYEDCWENVQLMTLAKKSDLCLKDSPCKKTKNEKEFTINEREIVTNFKDGYIVVQYYAFDKDEYGLPTIPNIPHVEDAIETYIVYRAFQTMYYNNTADVLQRMQYAEIQHQLKYKEALSYINLPTFAKMVEMTKKNKNKWGKFYPPESRPTYATWWYSPQTAKY